MAPTYVFVREGDLDAVRRMERRAGTAYSTFSIFRYNGGTVFVAHKALHPMRQQQQDSLMASLPLGKQVLGKDRGLAYEQGERVKLKNGPPSGFGCTVNSRDGLTTTLILTLFGREAGVKVSTSLLRADDVSTLAFAA